MGIDTLDPRTWSDLTEALVLIREMRKQAILKDWAPAVSTWSLAAALEMDRVAAADAGFEDVWQETHDNAVAFARKRMAAGEVP